jgi:SAM-dependent methyltransferase
VKCAICGSSDFSHRVDDLENLDNLEFKVHNVFGVELIHCKNCDLLFAGHFHQDTLYRCYAGLNLELVPAESLDSLRFYSEEVRRDICAQQHEYLSSHVGNNLGNCLLYVAGRSDGATEFLPGTESLSVVDMVPSAKLKSINGTPIHNLDESALDLPDNIGSFDTVVVSNVLERLLNPKLQIRRISRLLKENGVAFIEAPNERLLADTYGYYGAHHINFFSADSLRQLIEQEGSFDILDFGSANQPIDDLLRTGQFKHEHRVSNDAEGRTYQIVLRNIRPNTMISDLQKVDPQTSLYSLGMQNMLLNIHMQNSTT